MAKFSKPFSGCKSGEIYPTEFQQGDECPAELEDAARSCGALMPVKQARRAPADDEGN